MTVLEDPLIPSGREPVERKVCSDLWQRMTIRANGDVMACCNLAYKLKVGNIKEKSIHDIWHGREMNRLRELHLQGRYNEIPLCRSCMR